MVGVLFRRGRIAPIAANDFQKKILVKQQASKEVGWIVWSTCDGPFDVMQTRSRDSDCPQRQWGSCGGITHTNTYTACRFVGRVGTERINTWPWPLQFILLSLSLSRSRAAIGAGCGCFGNLQPLQWQRKHEHTNRKRDTSKLCTQNQRQPTKVENCAKTMNYFAAIYSLECQHGRKSLESQRLSCDVRVHAAATEKKEDKKINKPKRFFF